MYRINRHKRHNRHRAEVLTGCRETFSKVCSAGKTTAVVEGGALIARENVRPVDADFPQRRSASQSAMRF